MIKIMYYTTIFCVLLSGCKRDVITEIIINPQNTTDKQVVLSDFVDELIYIPLDNEVIFSGIISLDISGNHVVIGTQGAPLLQYDIEGNFINRIGSRGRGPGEYQFAHHFVIDSKSNKVYIYDNNKIITYSTDGKLIGEFYLFDSEGHPSQIFYKDGKIYLAYNLMYGNAKYNWCIVDTIGNLHSYKLNHIPTFSSSILGRAGFISIENELYYWNDYNDSIFVLQENSFTPAMYFARGDFRKPYSRIEFEDRWRYFFPWTFFNTKDYLILYYLYNRHNHLALVDKKDGRILTIDKGTSGLRGYEPGIKNDIDGGLNFHPYYSFTEEGNTFLVTWYFAYRLKGYVQSEAFRNSSPKYPEKKKKLEELAASLDENDNQILMLVKLKR
jgi:hypothetical protein